LGLQIRHSVGQVLEELSLRLQELLHGGIHMCLSGCSSWMIHCQLIDPWSWPGVHHLSVRDITLVDCTKS
jgi:hypothetical protein